MNDNTARIDVLTVLIAILFFPYMMFSAWEQELGRELESKGYTLDELATLSESSKSYIWELENKNPPRPSAQKLAKIAKALDVTMDYFIDDEVTEEDATDKVFYRKYRKLSPENKKKFQQMIEIWDDEQ